MKLGSVGMSTSHWYAIVALWFAPGAEEGHGTAQRARTYSTALVSKSDYLRPYPRDTRITRRVERESTLFRCNPVDFRVDTA